MRATEHAARLTEAELTGLFASYALSRDLSTRNRLVEAHMGLVVHVVRRLAQSGPGFPTVVEVDDLVSWGTFGLIDAVERFELDRGLTFANFATTRIWGAIQDEARHQDWAPRSVRSRSRRWANAYDELSGTLGHTPTAAESTGLGSRPEQPSLVVAYPTTRFQPDDATDLRYDNDPAQRNNPGAEAEITEWRDRLAGAIAQLPDRMRVVLALHYREELGLGTIAELLGCSAALVCGIQTDALSRLAVLVAT